MAKGNPNIAKQGKNTRFSSKNQPQNRGRKGKSVTDFLKSYGEAKELSFEINTTDKDGEKKLFKGEMNTPSTINQVIAVTIINKAIKGDNKALQTYLDRTEGKPSQHIDHTTDGEPIKSVSPIDWAK